jgi:hypothetical protein
MTLNDILLEQQLNKISELDRAWQRFQHEAQEIDRQQRRGPRGSLASMLVRLGVWIDRTAGERVLNPGA